MSLRDYRKYRRLGYTASVALHYAYENTRSFLIKEKFEVLETLGVVRLQVVPDDCPDFSYLDQDEFSDIRDKEYQRANNYGVWGIVGEVLIDDDDWEHVDSCFGFIDDDWKGSGYDTDIMSACIEAAQQSRVMYHI